MNTYTQQQYLDKLSRAGLVLESNLYGQEGKVIRGLTYNSKEVEKDTLFVCKGAAFRPEYLEDALSGGASLYVSEQKFPVSGNVPYIIVSDVRKAMPYLADLFFNSPAKELNLIGIGGTKGKSTTAYYIKAILDDYLTALGKKKSAIISSIGVYDGKVDAISHITTPENIELMRHFRNAVDSGISFLEMEVSSQALKYDRVDEIMFDVGIFLNISEDHISPIEHPDFEDYFCSKMKMFQQTRNALICTDADYFDRVRESASAAGNVITFGTKEGSDIYCSDIRKVDHETHFHVSCDRFDEDFVLTMPGFFNVENALAAIAAAYVFDIPVNYMKSALYKACTPGRMETCMSKDENIIAVIDYAHNKLSFEKLFSSTRKEYPDRSIVAVFGCPGCKAYNRRKDMGTIAGIYSTKVYLTEDDPAKESVVSICEEIGQYLDAQHCPYEIIEDRKEAIHKAITDCSEKIVLLVAGKGNETSQKCASGLEDYASDMFYTKLYLEEYDQAHPQK